MTNSTRQAGEAGLARLPGETVAWSWTDATQTLRFTSWHPDQAEADPLIPASDLEQVIRERDGLKAALAECRAGRRMISSGAMDLGAMHCAAVAERDEAVRLLRPFAVYYEINDCDERDADDALEVPIGDLRMVRAFLSTMENRDG